MAGPKRHLKILWDQIIGDPDYPENGGIYMGMPSKQKRFLGCEHIRTTVKDKDGHSVDVSPATAGGVKHSAALPTVTTNI